MESNLWVLPANPKYYDIERQRSENIEIEWSQRNKFEVGDIVFIYVTAPVKEICYKCIVTETNIDKNNRKYNDDKYYRGVKEREGQLFVRLKYLTDIEPGELTLDKLRILGLQSSMQSAFKAKDAILEKLSKY